MKVAAMRDREDWPPRLLLFLSADVGESAVEASVLVDAVASGSVDCAIARPVEAGHQGMTAGFAAAAIRRATGWDCAAPLSEIRCITREALNAVMPFTNGYGLEPSLTIDLLAAGYSVLELPCAFEHTGADQMLGQFNRTSRYFDVSVALWSHRLRRVAIDPEVRRVAARQQKPGQPYPDDARALRGRA